MCIRDRVHHDINQAINYSDEIIAMKDGRMLFQGKPNEVITSNARRQPPHRAAAPPAAHL